MAIYKDLATLIGHLEPFNHFANSIIYDADESFPSSVKDVIDSLIADIGTAGYPSIAGVPCGVGVFEGMPVYVDNLGDLQPANSSSISTSHVIGVVFEEIDSFGNCNIKTVGPVGGYVGLTIGQKYYLSTTVPGGLQSTPPTGSGEVVKLIGTAINSTTLFVNTTQPLVVRS
jgi:hypothetical protein